ncbi:glycine zipper 2TM domain-containing protein [Pseudoduganella ginsengisoli]|uniref:Glycine zipper 2TM domain-containing protein n=1 Tax=Pseudoduganella ginsengisoli TaxID=1462440 RepID=A0A6L6Q9Y1_9BURK|nr:glycine zipper 2TM domain-containing protein [Pseudoduganella ginsengisoli]MTW06008.1 glycine zipper 2TM domain-containing protein [Pseudoduganella ginsengisoli]
MNTNRTHPLLLVAAVAVVLFCTFGIASILGWLPSRTSDTATQATSPAYAVGDSGTSAAYGSTAAPGAGVSSGVSSYGASGSGTAPQSNYVAGPAPARDYTPARNTAPVREVEPAYHTAQAPAAPAVCSSCGVVESIHQETHRAQGSGLGAGAGAVVGGLLGHQIGGGTGRQLATVAGAVGGAVVGNQVEGNARATHTYVITVRMDNGKVRTFHQSAQPGWRPGDPVRIVNGALHSR